MIEAGALPERAKANAIAIFNALGEAEAKVHGVPIEKVHFHEVGAVDSICDIVGACVWARSARRGGGLLLAGQHGQRHGGSRARRDAGAGAGDGAAAGGQAVYARGPETELTTPTGAAILAGARQGLRPDAAMAIASIGFGAGDEGFPGHANVLRVLIGESDRRERERSRSR